MNIALKHDLFFNEGIANMSQKFPFDHFLDSSQKTETTKKIINDRVLKQDPELIEAASSASAQEIQDVNNEILSQLKSSISPQKFDAYFEKNFVLAKINTDTLDFSVTTPFIKTMIDKHFTSQIKNVVTKILGKSYKINIKMTKNHMSLSSNKNNILNSIKNEESLGNKKNDGPKKPTFTLDLMPTKDDLNLKVESKYIDYMNPSPTNNVIIDHSKTFDSFIVGPSNNLAFAAVSAVAQKPGKSGKYPSLYIHSNSGLGKTHLLYAVANKIRELYPSMIINLMTARDFMKEMIDAIQNQDLQGFQKKYSKNTDILMIDDIHDLKNKKGTQNEFFHVFNELYNKGKQLIFTSDKSPNEIDGIEERIKTRLQWGLVIDIQPPDLETRIAILKRKSFELDFYISDEILNLIACSIKSSIRELEGSLIKLSAFSDVMKTEIETEMVKDLLCLNDGSDIQNITLEKIAKTTCQYFKIPLADIKSKSRSKIITRSRHIAMYLSKKMVRVPLLEIGRFYGGRDHTSVMHAVRKIENQLKNDASLSKDMILIENNF
ncbi:MAG: chromosomal replication initiator protein DnaA [Bacteriovoracaceae bacterium]|nr:chromosomal replication initiator protein DnaA [Bacteriovoracaceae bacterium]